MQMTKAAAWLDAKFVKWRNAQTSRRASVEKFAESVGIERFDFYNVMKGQGLSVDKVARIAKALDDDSAFEAFDVDKPSPLRWALEKLIDALAPDEQQKLLDYAEELKGKKAAQRAKPKTSTPK